MHALEKRTPRLLLLDVSGVEYCDAAGVALFLEIGRRQRKAGGEIEMQGLSEELSGLLDLFHGEDLEPGEKARRCPPLLEEIGRAAVHVWDDLGRQVAFVGELTVHLARVIARPRTLRFRDALVVAETAGANALPLIALIGFLIGLILAFQSAVPL